MKYSSLPNNSPDTEVWDNTNHYHKRIYGKPVSNHSTVDMLFGFFIAVALVAVVVGCVFIFGAAIKDALVADINTVVNVTDLQVYIKEGVGNFRP